MIPKDQLKKEIIDYLLENGEHEDMVDISCHIAHKYGCTVDVPAMAVHELTEEGRIQRLEHSPVRAGYRVLRCD